MSDFVPALRPGGTLILSGVLQTEAPAIIEAARASCLQLVREDREDEWWSGRFVIE